MNIYKDTAEEIPFFMADAADGKTGLTGLSPTVTVSKKGTSSFSAAGGSVTEIANGWYYYTTTTGETDTAGRFVVRITGTGADPWNDYHYVKDDLETDAISAAAVSTAAIEKIAAHLLTTTTTTLEANGAWQGYGDKTIAKVLGMLGINTVTIDRDAGTIVFTDASGSTALTVTITSTSVTSTPVSYGAGS